MTFRAAVQISCYLFLLTGSAHAQTYVVTTDDAVFVDAEGQAIGSASKHTEIYVWERKDGRLLAIHPDTQIAAWISSEDVSQKELEPAARHQLAQESGRLSEIETLVNADSATTAQFESTKAWQNRLRELHGDTHPDSVTAIQFTGLVAQNARLFSEARRLLQEALTAAGVVHGKDSDKAAEIHLDLAYVLADLSLLADAARQAKAAAIIRARRYGSDHPTTMEAFLPLAMAMESISDDESALGYYTKVLSAYSKHYGEDDERAMKTRGRIADVQSRLGRTTDAKRSYESILSQLRNQQQRQEGWIARTELKLSFLGVADGHPDQIDSFLQQSRVFRKQHPRSAGFAHELDRRLVADMLRSQQTSLAFRIMDAGMRDLRNQLRIDLWGVERRTQLDYLRFADAGRFHESVATAITFRHSSDALRYSSEWLLNGKGLVREAQAVRLGFQDNVNRRDEWAQARWVSLADFQKSLPENSAYVDFLRFPFSAVEENSKPELPTFQYAAWVTRPTGPQQLIILGDAEQIDQSVRKLRQTIVSTAQSIKQIGDVNAEKQLLPVLTHLSRQLWHPIAEAVGSAEKLILSPDGETWLLPWTALLSEDGSFAVEDYEIQLLLSGRELLQNPTDATVSPAVIFADPDYGTTETSAENSSTRSSEASHRLSVKALDYSAQEAAAARLALSELNESAPRIVTGSNATEAQFMSLRSPSVLLLSTHGFFFDANDTSDSSDPLLRCCLLFSNANHCPDYTALANDGVVNGVEVMSADLQGTRLAVLSACQTGIGETTAVEGVTGLRTAFHLAGVQSVVSTLWSIHDRETAYLVSDFFEQLNRVNTIAAALRQAQLQRIRSRRKRYGAAHPFFWAAFTVSRDLSTQNLAE